MAQCEDFPCCGHERGCCPDFDPETGAQLNMVCTCGAKLPINNPSSICDRCLRAGDDDFDRGDYDDETDEDDGYEEDGMTERFDEADIETRFE